MHGRSGGEAVNNVRSRYVGRGAARAWTDCRLDNPPPHKNVNLGVIKDTQRVHLPFSNASIGWSYDAWRVSLDKDEEDEREPKNGSPFLYKDILTLSLLSSRS